MTYYLTVRQDGIFPLIEIQIRRHPDDGSAGYISVQKGLDSETFRELAPAIVRPNVTFGGAHTPDEAREVADWWRVAAAAAETLDALIKTREDLARPVRAWMVVKTMVIEFEEAKGA